MRPNFTSRILEGLVARRGLVEPRMGIGCGVAVEPVMSEADKEKGPRGATAGAFQARTSADLGPA